MQRRAERRALLAEGIRKTGLVQRNEISEQVRFYYGISPSRYFEPLDQLDVPLLIARLRRSGLDASLLVFVAGRYAELNGKPAAGLVAAEKTKTAFLQDAGVVFNLPVETLSTNDLWYSGQYWIDVDCLRSVPGMIDETRRGKRFSEVFSSFEPYLQNTVPPELVCALGDFQAPSLYRLFEVAEASFLMKCNSIQAKAGPDSEEQYDCFIRGFMGIVQLFQPLDFRSCPGCAKPLTPYIGKEGEQRIFIGDSKEEIGVKVGKLAQRSSDQPVYYGGFMNPFVRTAILAVEAAAAQGSAPVSLGTRKAFDGAAVLDFFGKAGTDKLQRYASAVVECLWAYLVQPMQKRMAGNVSTEVAA